MAEPISSGPLTIEGEETLFEANGIVFHFDTPTSTWTHCGRGTIQLLKDRSTRRVLFFSQRRSTREVTGNHLVPITSDTKLQPNKGYEERSWVWVAKSDYSSNTGVPKKEIFAVRFTTGADAQAFKASFEYSQKNNTQIEQSTNNTAESPDPRLVAEALAVVGITGTAILGSDNEVNGALLNHGPQTESVPGREGKDDIGPA